MNHLLFVDDNPVVLQSLQRQLHGLAQEWQMTFVESGQSALDFMAANPVDVIVADMVMPGMDGAELLAEVKRRHPTVVRIVLSGEADREAILRLVGPAHQYLSKPCSVNELRGAVLRAFAMRDMLANEQLKQLVTRTKSLPALPALYLQLIEELRQPDASVESISRIISQDLGMTSKILQLVNSAFFGLPQPMADIQEAVMYLGLATIRALVLSIQVFSQFDQRRIKGFSIQALSDHCWMTGTLARNIARLEHCDEKTADQCFMAGLLHDVGQLLLATGMPEEYGRVLETVSAQEQPIWEAELAQFGATHAEVGGYLLGLWGLPDPIVEAVTLHHRPADAATRGFSPVIAVHVANAFAHDLTHTNLESPGNLLDTDCLANFGLTERLARWKSQVLDGHVATLETAEKA